MAYWVYILASAPGGTLYVGVTNDLVRRTFEHREGLAEGFTRKYGVKRLVYFEPHDSIIAAIQRHFLRLHDAGKRLKQGGRLLVLAQPVTGLGAEVEEPWVIRLPCQQAPAKPVHIGVAPFFEVHDDDLLLQCRIIRLQLQDILSLTGGVGELALPLK